MKKTLIIIFGLLVLSQVLEAQTYQYDFEYDNAGNRTTRTYIELKSTDDPSFYDSLNHAINEEMLPENPIEDLLGTSNVKIYPNPTRGELVLKFVNLPEQEKIEMQLHDMSGKLLQQKEITETYYLLDMHGYPNGNYLMRLKTAQAQKTYEIIKN